MLLARVQSWLWTSRTRRPGLIVLWLRSVLWIRGPPVAALQQQIGSYLTSYLVKAVVVLNGNPDFRFRYEHLGSAGTDYVGLPAGALWFAVVQELSSEFWP